MIKTLNEMINSKEYQSYANDSVYSLQDHCINPSHYDTNAGTMEEHIECGMQGVSHSDVIQNQRNYLNNLDLEDDIYDAIEKEINAVEEWHINKGSIETII